MIQEFNKRILESYYNIFVLFDLHTQSSNIMSTGGASQSQASYLNTTEEKAHSYEPLKSANLLDQQIATKAMTQLCIRMSNAEGDQFEKQLQNLNILFQKGYTHLFMTQTLLMRKMMNHFTRLGKLLQESDEDSNAQLRMLFILSIIAQILRSNPKFYYPFTRKFLITVFTIDAELLQGSPIKKDILAILGVIFENLSRQPKLIHKYAIQSNLKLALLESYSLIEEIFTLKNMNKSISNLTKRGIEFSSAEFKKYRVLDTVNNIISKSQVQLFMIKIKMTMLNANGRIPSSEMSIE